MAPAPSLHQTNLTSPVTYFIFSDKGRWMPCHCSGRPLCATLSPSSKVCQWSSVFLDSIHLHVSSSFYFKSHSLSDTAHSLLQPLPPVYFLPNPAGGEGGCQSLKKDKALVLLWPPGCMKWRHHRSSRLLSSKTRYFDIDPQLVIHFSSAMRLGKG